MKNIFIIIFSVISFNVFSQDIGICGLPLTTIGTNNDLIIKEDSDCANVNGTRAMTIANFISHYKILTATGSYTATPLFQGTNTYTANTVINSTGTFSVNPTSTLTLNSGGNINVKGINQVYTPSGNFSVSAGGVWSLTSTGIGTISSATVNISSTTVQLPNAGTPGLNKVFTSDASGYATWQTPAAVSSASVTIASTSTGAWYYPVVAQSPGTGSLPLKTISSFSVYGSTGAVVCPQITSSFIGDGSGITGITYGQISSVPMTIFTPTTTATVALTVNRFHAINPSGTIAALTITFPNSPVDRSFVEVKSSQIITTVTYNAGTGGATIKGQINFIVGSYEKWVYDSGTNTWY